MNMLSYSSPFNTKKSKNFFIQQLSLNQKIVVILSVALDEELQEQVKILLKAREESNGFLENISALDAVQSLSAFNMGKFIGRRFGKYLIVRELGRGGNGSSFSCRT
jgi:hypothetical protein